MERSSRLHKRKRRQNQVLQNADHRLRQQKRKGEIQSTQTEQKKQKNTQGIHGLEPWGNFRKQPYKDKQGPL